MPLPGVIQNEVIMPKLKELFTLSCGQVMLVQFCYVAMCFIISLPATARSRRLRLRRVPRQVGRPRIVPESRGDSSLHTGKPPADTVDSNDNRTIGGFTWSQNRQTMGNSVVTRPSSTSSARWPRWAACCSAWTRASSPTRSTTLTSHYSSACSDQESYSAILATGGILGALLSGLFARFLGRKRSLAARRLHLHGRVGCTPRCFRRCPFCRPAASRSASESASPPSSSPSISPRRRPRAIRGSMGTLFQLMITIGIFLISVSNVFIARTFVIPRPRCR